jgi:hypothetical protein
MKMEAQFFLLSLALVTVAYDSVRLGCPVVFLNKAFSKCNWLVALLCVAKTRRCIE